MGVVNTDEWLKKETNPLKICGKLKGHFQGLHVEDIHQYLSQFGMYKSVSKSYIQKMLKRNVWERVKKHYQYLNTKWAGPDIPIYIFPVNESNGFLSRNFGGRSGVSFPDKLFLFLSYEVDEEELKSVLTHEYHHICRISKYEKKEENYTLLDTIILEGLAEHAVGEMLGEQALTFWVKKYSPSQLNRWWNLWIKPHQEVTRDDPKYIQLLYGMSFYPKMLGYAIGYHIVRTYDKKHKMTIKDSFTISVERLVAFYEKEIINN